MVLLGNFVCMIVDSGCSLNKAHAAYVVVNNIEPTYHVLFIKPTHIQRIPKTNKSMRQNGTLMSSDIVKRMSVKMLSQNREAN